VRWKILSGTYLGAKTFHTIRCLLRIAAAHTEAKTCEESRGTECWDVIYIQKVELSQRHLKKKQKKNKTIKIEPLTKKGLGPSS